VKTGGPESCCRDKVVINVFYELASEKKIIRVDMDAFYASVAPRDNPDQRLRDHHAQQVRAAIFTAPADRLVFL
jgi:hypothetical protein